MELIKDKSGSGKTKKLIALAAEAKGIIVCGNVQAMSVKINSYGYKDIECISYDEFLDADYSKLYYIDDLDKMLDYYGVVAATITEE